MLSKRQFTTFYSNVGKTSAVFASSALEVLLLLEAFLWKTLTYTVEPLLTNPLN